MKITPINKLLVITISCLLSASYIGCKKDNNIKSDKTGTVINYGNPSADGCGWVIRVDQVDYKPENLDKTYEVNNLKVNIDYNLLKSSYQCGLAANIGFSYIHINSISKK
jgi:hypothetical protein